MPAPRWFRNGFIYLVIFVAAVAILFTIFPPDTSSQLTDIGTFVQRVKQGDIQEIEVDGDRVVGILKNKEKITSRKESAVSLQKLLEDSGVKVGVEGGVKLRVVDPSRMGDYLGILMSFLPIALFAGIIIFMMRQSQGSSNQAFSFGKSKARMFGGNRPTITFADVAGVEEAKQELQEVVEFLKTPEKFSALGARIPRGVLLVGPPGTGKTLLSRAVAGEAGVPFFSISGSEFVELFVGVGASRVRDLFDQAKRNAPCIVFIDEIDAVGRRRGAGLGASHDEREQTLNQILVEMDGFDTNTNVIVIAATNRPDVLDPALLRPGRFDRQVILDLPDIAGRRAILDVHIKGKPIDPEVNLEVIAKQTPGFSGADLANLVNEAAILAARRNKTSTGMDEMAEAIDRVVAGPERKSRVISPKEKEITAYHEAGHALVGRMLPNSDTVHKISIVARGSMGGYTRYLPEEDRHMWTRSQFNNMLAAALGGRTAEELVFNEITTGAQSDIERATKLARQMVTDYGMSQKLGPRSYGHKEELVFLGREISETRNYSETIAQVIDDEVHDLIQRAHNKAREILAGNRARLDAIAEYLIQKETLEGVELERLFTMPFSTDKAVAVAA